MSPRSALGIAIGLATVSITGCATQLDMATPQDPGRPATTIPYAGVRGAQFSDYGAIGQSILTGKDPAPAPQPKGKGK
ncbi:MAG: hypothetical protein R3B70_06190 [Polyangiaceae bacterium]